MCNYQTNGSVSSNDADFPFFKKKKERKMCNVTDSLSLKVTDWMNRFNKNEEG